jgi:hypothetical protein
VIEIRAGRSAGVDFLSEQADAAVVSRAILNAVATARGTNRSNRSERSNRSNRS